MAQKIRIMHVTGSLNIGGVEEILWLTAKMNPVDKYDLAFTACRSQEGFSSRQIQQLGYKVFGLGASQRMYDVRIIPRLFRVFRQFRPHIVHFYFKVSFLGRFAAKLAGVPIIICNEADMDWELYGGGMHFLAMVKRKFDFLADKIIACSQAVRNYWGRGETHKYVVIYNPFDMNKISAVADSPLKTTYKNGAYPVIGTVSRIDHIKGHEYLIKAMPKILSSWPLARLKIVGSGPLLEQMKQLANSLGLQESVQFTGALSGTMVNKAFSVMDIFVLPSLTEAFGIAAVEAMASGLPVVASAVGGLPEIIDHDITGLLISPRSEDAIAEAINGLLTDFPKAKEMGDRARKSVMRRFSPKLYMQKLDDLYEALLSQKGIVSMGSMKNA